MLGKIKDKKEVATGTLQVTFETDEDFTFKPGQYCFITLKNLTFPDERGNRRHFSIVNSPNQKRTITFATRLREESGFKKTLKELPLGTEVELGPIAGVFTLPEDTQRPLVFIAGGIGITPFMSMLQFVKEENLPYKQSLKSSLRSDYKITLIYSNRDQSSTAFLNEVQNLAQEIPNFKLILTMTEDPSWNEEKRKIDAQFIKEYLPDVNSYSYFVVGPPPMVGAIEIALAEAGVKAENIKIENFSGY